jgi:hypothetical protein
MVSPSPLFLPPSPCDIPAFLNRGTIILKKRELTFQDLLPAKVVFGLVPLDARVQFVIDDFFIPEPIRIICLTNTTMPDRK